MFNIALIAFFEKHKLSIRICTIKPLIQSFLSIKQKVNNYILRTKLPFPWDVFL